MLASTVGEDRGSRWWMVAWAGALGLTLGCATDDSGGAEARGEAILRVRVSALASAEPVAGATIRLFADHQRGCVEQGPLTAELLTESDGALRVQSEGVVIPGGTCFSLAVLPPPDAGLRAVERVPFQLEFRPAPPLDSVQVEVALEPGP